MKKNLNIIIIIIIMCSFIVIFCCGCAKKDKEISEKQRQTSYNNSEESVQLIERLFNINECKYQIVEEKNELSENQYGGKYTVVLNVGTSHIDNFMEKLKANYSESIYDDDVNANLVKNIFGKELDENNTFFTATCSAKRNIEGVEFLPKTCSINILCLEEVDGIYEIIMNYSE